MRPVIVTLFLFFEPSFGWAFSSSTTAQSFTRPSVTSSALTVSLSSTENAIREAEVELGRAMLASDVTALEKLLHDDLIFTNHLGLTMGKEDDLEAHRKAIVNIKELTLSDMEVRLLCTTAVVTVAAHIVGSFLGDSFEDTLRFTRVWHRGDGDEQEWAVIAAHSSLVAAQSVES